MLSVQVNDEGLIPAWNRSEEVKQGMQMAVQVTLPQHLPIISILPLIQSGESNRPLTPILLKSIAIHLPFPS